ncbi:sulfite exporter TauE/SafE family protein [Fulvivirga sp. RKSG066]|uniref:sulfite exporter TauE/SafE family protein n=1 Tax=Fulvivirga aurantia TaxID=2529383 RepID=UPI0012BCF540|nr:sulfite exporter TauE/SafE family protein [Fulvivirga aurantia]MTI22323.1 sulfite exporter TauE/SafE family protein [Fulvivirga aurantia]
MESVVLLSILFFFIAALYSSVGFGGGSSYLAIMILAGIELHLLRSTALLCNIIVVSGGTYFFIKSGCLKLKEAAIISICSVPLAFLGGYLPIEEKVIFILLGISLLVAAILLWFKKDDLKTPAKKKPLKYTLGVGGIIGFISGMIGIGGGIFLSPFLHFIKWDKAKQIAAIASFFILVNSVSGLAGQWYQNEINVNIYWAWPLLLSVFLGGQIGSRIAIKSFDHMTIKRITSFVILIAALKILNDHLINLL